MDVTLRALANPARRAILELVWDAERTSSEIAEAVGATRPATSQHLKVLGDAGLVQVRADGSQRLYRVDSERLAEVRAALERFWGGAARPAVDSRGRRSGAGTGRRDAVTGQDAAEDAVTCEAVVPAPPEEVFRWFVEPELLVRWIGIDAQLEPRPGGLFRFEIAKGEWCSGRYLEAVPRRHRGLGAGRGQRGPLLCAGGPATGSGRAPLHRPRPA